MAKTTLDGNMGRLVANAILPGLEMAAKLIQDEIGKYHAMLNIPTHSSEVEQEVAEVRPTQVQRYKPQSRKALLSRKRAATNARKVFMKLAREYRRLGGTGTPSKAKLAALKAAQ